MKKAIFIEITCFLFITLFIYAAGSKLLDTEKFSAQIGQSPLLTNFAGVVAWTIPIVEIVISLMLATARLRLVGLYAAFSIMVMFTIYIVAILNFSENIPCSCGGVLEKLGWTEHLIFNAGFVLLALVSIVLYSTLDSNSRNLDPGSSSKTTNL